MTVGVLRMPSARVGLGLLMVVVGIALLGPFFVSNDPDLTVGVPASPPSAGLPLGTDFVGRDVLSRVLDGGRLILVLALVATIVSYVIGAAIGLFSGYRRGLFDAVAMRGIDIWLSFPAFLFILIMIAALGSGMTVVVISVAVVQAPGIARLIRTATVEVTVRGYVEAAQARGEGTLSILRRDILPSIAAPVLADLGLRLTFSVLIIAGINFLGIGLQPPAADWSVMIFENRQQLFSNPYAVLVPAAIIALLTIGINLFGDAVARSLGRSSA